MNERIQKLYIQVVGDDKLNFDSYLAEKFTELIVEEMYCFMCDATDNDKPWPSFKEVKQHFGVEE